MKRWILLACLLLGSPALAQEDTEPTTAELLKRLEKQEAELEALKEQVRERPSLADAEAAPPESESAPLEDKIRLGFFYIESADKRTRLDMKWRLIAEYRFAEAGQADFDNGFEVRQLRVDLKGKLWDRITYQISLEWGGGASDALRQGWVNLRIFDWLQIKAGQDKLPLTFSFQESFKYMNHAEWPIAVGNEAQNFELGAQLWGWIIPKKFKYVLAAFNGNGPNTTGDEDDDVDIIARLEAIPFKYFNIHVAGNYTPTDTEAVGPRSGRTFGNRYTLFTVFDPGNRRLGERYIATTGAVLRTGPFEILGEFLFAYNRKLESGVTGKRMNLSVWSYFFEGVWIITGEDKLATIRNVESPLYDSDANWGTGSWGFGAWAVSLRYEEIQFEDSAISRGFAVGTNAARGGAVTLSWWAWKNLRYSITYNYTAFEDRIPDSKGNLHNDDHIVVIRAWLTF